MPATMVVAMGERLQWGGGNDALYSKHSYGSALRIPVAASRAGVFGAWSIDLSERACSLPRLTRVNVRTDRRKRMNPNRT